MYHYFAMLSRMKHIDRWGLMHSIHKENLSEHSLETAFITHALCTIANKRLNMNLDAEKASTAALFHDTEEIITGDLPTPIKYNNETIKKAYKDIEKEAGKRLLSMLPDDLRPTYEELYDLKDERLKKIIKAADKISALIKCTEELKLGNGEFKIAYDETLAKISAMDLPEVKIFMEEFMPSYALTLDEQQNP